MTNISVISDSPTFLLEKVSLSKNIIIQRIIDLTPDCCENIPKDTKIVLLLISELFYKQFELSKANLSDLESNINYQLSIIDSLINKLSSLGIQIYIPFVPKHFIFFDLFGSYFIDKDSNDLYIQKINIQLYNNYNHFSNIIFLTGIKTLSEVHCKNYFRFSSIYDKYNCNKILDQFLEYQKQSYIKRKKLIILDLDNTLWKGVLGDDLIDGITMDKSDPVGSVFRYVQNIFLQFKHKGFLLAICSKNDEKTALKALFDNPASIFKKSDIVAFRINWRSKSENILELCQELNISIFDTILVDDSEYECDEVKANCNGISVFKVPKNIYKYPALLSKSPLFYVSSTTSEDKRRTDMYNDSIERTRIFKEVINREGTKNDWIKSLSLRLIINKITITDKSINRIIQLFNRTNQFNLASSKYNHLSFENVLKKQNTIYYAASASDRIGSEGIISVIGFTFSDKKIIVTDYILSCRVFGRYIEESMLLTLFNFAVSTKSHIYFNLIDNDLNLVVKEFISKITNKSYYLSLDKIYSLIKEYSVLPIEIIDKTLINSN